MSCGPKLIGVPDYPRPCEFVFDPGRDFGMVLPMDQAVALQLAQAARQHPLRYAVQAPGQFGVAQPAGDAKLMNDSE